MTTAATNPPIEVEAKFLGGQHEFKRILDWLNARQHFKAVRQPCVHRIHVYFDEGSKLRDAGCRLRCVLAAGEWCRYDFKAEGPSGATLEVAIKKDTPAPLPEMIDELVKKLHKGRFRRRLEDVKQTARIILTALGTHEKAVCSGPTLELEVSRDVLTSLESGTAISEVEVELESGKRGEFDRQIALMGAELKLERTFETKLERLMQAGAHNGSRNRAPETRPNTMKSRHNKEIS